MPIRSSALPAPVRHVLTAALLATFPIAASAQSATDLDTVEVRAPIARSSGTVTKTDTRISEIPQSVSVITDQQMRDRAIHGVEEAVWFTAGAQGGGYGGDPRSDWLLLRGFTPARYMDGLALAEGTGTGITRVEPYGLERVEVLKGPSSVTYGAMPPGGMINYVSKRPTEETLREIEVQAGSYDLFQVAGDFGGRLTADGVWTYRLTALARNSDDQVDYVHDDRYLIAPALTWKPDEANSLTLLARWQRNDTVAGAGFLPQSGTLTPNPFGKIPAGRYTGEPGFNDYDKTMSSVGWEYFHDFGGGTTFRQNLRYGVTEIDPSTSVGAFGLLADQRTLLRYLWKTEEESKNFGVDNQLQFQFATGAIQHTLLTGLDYRRARNEYASAFTFDGAPTLDIFNPVYGASIVEPEYTSRTRQTQSQFGLYAQDQMRIDRWVVTLGARQDWVGTDTHEVLAGRPTHQSDDKFSGRVGVNYLFDNGLAPYVGWSQSFQPTVGTDFFNRAFVPTTGEQTEVGLKYQPASNRILATLAVYELVQENTLVVDPNHTLYSIQQGETKVRGVELEGRWNIGHGLSVYGAYTYADTEVTQSTDPLSLGKEIPLQPEHVASLGADYTITEGALSGLGFGAGVRYTGEHYGDAYNQFQTPSYTLFDASVHYDIGAWRLQLNAQNVGDKEYIATCNSATWCYYGYPRTVTATARYQW
ncbi:TonB-dependent siderophore receptor [Lysobacter sp.]|uniref:TonB-dependent siderophore receptor n=1 Tax=Lysobacter sp. TaxID=72226 RepID=UPI002D761241|nr:TonB-dependent siderophore receptor [Lysobacter sp.]HZX77562.1 TonB-dependent siderophore receptor [Lysobacter sp.]